MTITQALAWLTRLQKANGSEILVYFDCPDCKTAFTPSLITTTAVHAKAEGK